MNRNKLVLVSLIGEQIIPNLLPLKHLKPAVSVAVFSNFSKTGYERLEKATRGEIKMAPCEVDAYNINAILPALHAALEPFSPAALLFNVTGGTKPMSIAAFQAAAALGAPVIYFQTEGKRSRVLRYEFQDGKAVMVGDEFLPPVISLDEYLRAHVEILPSRTRESADAGHAFERAVYEALSGAVDEIKMGINIQGAVEVDLAVRCENQAGILEVKTGSNKLKMAIDQLNTAGGQRYLGTYTQKFLVSDQEWSHFSDLRELASAHRILLVELPNYAQMHQLEPGEQEKLRFAVLKGLGKTA